MEQQPTLIYRDGEIGCFLIADLAVYRDVGSTPPEAASWRHYLREIVRFQPRIGRCLIIPRAAGLTARQREEIRSVIGGRPTAVLTGSLINRCIITSLSWFKVPIHAFPAGSYREALRWLAAAELLPLVLRGLELYPPAQPVRAPRATNDSGTLVP